METELKKKRMQEEIAMEEDVPSAIPFMVTIKHFTI